MNRPVVNEEVLGKLDERFGDDFGDSMYAALQVYQNPDIAEGQDDWSHKGMVAGFMYSLPIEVLNEIMAKIKLVRHYKEEPA